jgi:carboxyl-terminal processing protease
LKVPLPKIPTLLLIAFNVLVLAAAIIGCNLFERDSQPPIVSETLDILSSDAPEEFGVLFEVYNHLLEDHYDRDNLTATQLSRGAIKGMLDALDDDHSAYLDPELFSAELERFRGNFEGIGAEVTERNGQIIVVAPIPDTPAEDAGINSGDIILEVNGQSVEGLGVYEVVDLIRGPRGTEVELLILHPKASSPTRIVITRGVVIVPTLDLRILSGGLAHVQLHFFGENTLEEFGKAMERAERLKARGIILDLRNNPGGRVDTVVDLTSRFLDDGLVLYQMDGRQNRVEYQVTGGSKAPDLPLIVLINEFSASASEIMAGALRDHGRARLVGTTTFGKGSVNIQRPLSDGSGVYYSIARWFTPGGDLIEGEGIEPDIMVESDDESSEDFQLDKAIELLREAIIASG